MHTECLSGNLKGRDNLRAKHRSEDNIKMDLRETGYDGVEWIYMAEDRDQWRALVNIVMNLRVT
jgi:hypothetical protein